MALANPHKFVLKSQREAGGMVTRLLCMHHNIHNNIIMLCVMWYQKLYTLKSTEWRVFPFCHCSLVNIAPLCPSHNYKVVTTLVINGMDAIVTRNETNVVTVSLVCQAIAKIVWYNILFMLLHNSFFSSLSYSFSSSLQSCSFILSLSSRKQFLW